MRVICKTPFRISFFGGGTDYPSWYNKYEGMVLATAIDKYCYLTVRPLPPYFDHKNRIVYSQVERTNSFEEIQHPVVRETLRYVKNDNGIDIHHGSDLSARAGLGTSSAFTVGLLHALHKLKGDMIYKQDIAEEAIHLEQEVLGEAVGSQDQVTTTYGGFNLILFKDNEFYLRPVRKNIEELRERLMLFYTGKQRVASEIAGDVIRNIPNRHELLVEMKNLVKKAINKLETGKLDEFGVLLGEEWELKKQLADTISNPLIDSVYKKAIDNGALGGKILGAGAGGFMLFYAPVEVHETLKKALELMYVPFNYDFEGTRIIYSGE